MRPLLLRTVSAAATVVVLGACAGSGLTGGGSASPSASASGGAIVGGDNVALHDDSTVHDIAVTFDRAAYDEMIAEYAATQDKTWIEVTATIDGVTIERVGMRLKGNSSLRGLTSTRGSAPSSTNSPQDLPWLIRFDKYVEGQSYQGLTEIVIRANNTETSLNEAVALELIGIAGEPTQEAVLTRFSVNGSPAALRLAIESPNDEWEDANFDTEGVLYKAESTGDYSYRGTDPEAYDEVFDQESDDEVDNLGPLIEFLDFVNNASDAAFAADLDDHLDVAAFARYLALQELVANFDDIDGPGNNAYLRYDESTGRITVLTWDLNLAFGGRPGGANGAPTGGRAGAAAPVPAGPPGGAGGAVMGGPRGRSNVLVQRFSATSAFAALVEQAKADLTTRLFTGGAASASLERWVGVLKSQAGELVDAATVDREAAAVRAYFPAR